MQLAKEMFEINFSFGVFASQSCVFSGFGTGAGSGLIKLIPNLNSEF